MGIKGDLRRLHRFIVNVWEGALDGVKLTSLPPIIMVSGGVVLILLATPRTAFAGSTD